MVSLNLRGGVKVTLKMQDFNNLIFQNFRHPPKQNPAYGPEFTTNRLRLTGLILATENELSFLTTKFLLLFWNKGTVCYKIFQGTLRYSAGDARF